MSPNTFVNRIDLSLQTPKCKYVKVSHTNPFVTTFEPILNKKVLLIQWKKKEIINISFFVQRTVRWHV